MADCLVASKMADFLTDFATRLEFAALHLHI